MQICWQFIFTNICQFLYIYLKISSNGVNFLWVPIVFTVSSFECWMQTLREQGLGQKAIVSSYPDKRRKLSTVKKVCIGISEQNLEQRSSILWQAILKANKVSKSEEAMKMSMRIIFKSVLMLFTKKYQN